MNGRSAQKVGMRGKTLVETIVPSLGDIVRTVQIIPDDTVPLPVDNNVPVENVPVDDDIDPVDDDNIQPLVPVDDIAHTVTVDDIAHTVDDVAIDPVFSVATIVHVPTTLPVLSVASVVPDVTIILPVPDNLARTIQVVNIEPIVCVDIKNILEDDLNHHPRVVHDISAPFVSPGKHHRYAVVVNVFSPTGSRLFPRLFFQLQLLHLLDL